MPSINMAVAPPVTKRVTITDYLATGASVTITDYPMGTRTMKSLTKGWSVTPGYRELVRARKQLPDNNFNYTFTSNEYEEARAWWFTPITGGIRKTEVYRRPYASIGNYIPAFVLTDSDVSQRLIEKAKHAQWNVPVFIAEAKKTATMVASRAVHLAQMALALRAGNLKRFISLFHPSVTKRPSSRFKRRFKRAFPKDPAGTASRAWLELRYGWLPFMGDVRNAVLATMDSIELEDNRVATVRSSIRRSNTILTPEATIWSESAQGLVVKGQYLQVVKESRRAVWRLSVNPSDLPARFGLVNPLEVLWELVPLSFVADWFLNIGSYLSALDVPFRFNHLGGVFGRRRETWMTTLNARVTSPSGGKCTGVGGVGYYVDLARTKMVSPPSVKLAWKGGSLGLTRFTSASALLTQALKHLGR